MADIYYVEDDESIAGAVKEYLEQRDCTVSVFRTIAAARQAFLSQSEYQLLLLLIRSKGKTVTRDRILNELWDKSGSYVNDNTLTVTMKRLREKLHNLACIKTVRSFGYRMEDTL